MNQQRQSIACTTLLLSALFCLSACGAPPTVSSANDVVAAAAVTSDATAVELKVTLAPLEMDRAETLARAELAERPAPSPVEVAVDVDCPSVGTRVLLIGDSLSVGLGPAMAAHARACGTPFHHHGVVGSHVTQWAHDSWLQPQLDRAQANVVVVSLGGNDFQRFDDENVRAGIDQFVAKVRSSGAKLRWISPPTMPFSDRVGVRDMWKQKIDGSAGIDWYPTEELVIPRAPDRVHPTIKGYKTLGKMLWQWVANAERKRATV
jgi:lysophospholipase L1-like esterase